MMRGFNQRYLKNVTYIQCNEKRTQEFSLNKNLFNRIIFKTGTGKECFIIELN